MVCLLKRNGLNQTVACWAVHDPIRKLRGQFAVTHNSFL